MFGFKKQRHDFILEEANITSVLEILNRHCKDRAYRVGNCGWADYPTRWFVMFHATDKEYAHVVHELMKIGTIHIEPRCAGGIVDYVFERGS